MSATLSNAQGVLADVNSYFPSNNPYSDSDKITHVHESCHGISSQLRNRLHKPAFYTLHDTYFVVDEPRTTLAAVAKSIPVEKRGPVYALYCVNAQQWWNDQPSYLIEEMVCYINGAEARKELGIKDRYETVKYAEELAVYVSYLPMTDWTFYKQQLKRLETLK